MKKFYVKFVIIMRSCLDDRCVAKCGDTCSAKSFTIWGLETEVISENKEDATIFVCSQKLHSYGDFLPEPQSIKLFSEEDSNETLESLKILRAWHLGESSPYIIHPQRKWDYNVISQFLGVQKFLSEKYYNPRA